MLTAVAVRTMPKYHIEKRTLPLVLSASSSRKCALPGGRTTVCTSAVGLSVPPRPLMIPVPATSPSSSVHFVNSNIFTSNGSPITSSSTIWSEWQVVSACKKLVRSRAVGRSCTLSKSSPNRCSERSSNRTPRISSPSSVSVPVLSKQHTLIFPPMLIRVGEMQNIPSLRRRPIAKLVPMDKVTGRAGGTTTVMRSKARIMIVFHLTYSRKSEWKKKVVQ